MSFLQALKKNKTVGKLADWYTAQAGYRNMGLLKDDLIPDENPLVSEAVRRLPRKDFYNRVYRFRRALNLSANQQKLPEDQWTKPEEDVPYMTTIMSRIELEEATKQEYDQLLGIPERLRNRNKV